MNVSVIWLAIVCIWPVDNTQAPTLAHAEATSREICEAGNVAIKAKLEALPTVHAFSTACVELDRGEKA